MSAPAKDLTEMLDVRAGEPADLVLRRATLLDPVAGIDGVHDLVVRGGRIAEIAAPGEADATDGEELDAEGLHAFPAFFDPHVHLRTPGQEHKEDVETGTALGGGGRLLRDHRDGQHLAADLDRRRHHLASRASARSRPRSRSASPRR